VFNKHAALLLLFLSVLMGGGYIGAACSMQRVELHDRPQERVNFSISKNENNNATVEQDKIDYMKYAVEETLDWNQFPTVQEKSDLLEVVAAVKESVCCFLIVLFTIICSAVEKLFVPVVSIYAFKKMIVDPLNKTWSEKKI
jgi:hypothetical protein